MFFRNNPSFLARTPRQQIQRKHERLPRWEVEARDCRHPKNMGESREIL